jgi:hypothetical protein
MAYKRKTENIDRERKKEKKHNKITINGERLSDGITAH